jgi:hypothetical protein
VPATAPPPDCVSVNWIDAGLSDLENTACAVEETGTSVESASGDTDRTVGAAELLAVNSTSTQ